MPLPRVKPIRSERREASDARSTGVKSTTRIHESTNPRIHERSDRYRRRMNRDQPRSEGIQNSKSQFEVGTALLPNTYYTPRNGIKCKTKKRPPWVKTRVVNRQNGSKNKTKSKSSDRRKMREISTRGGFGICVHTERAQSSIARVLSPPPGWSRACRRRRGLGVIAVRFTRDECR
jgi:hypothetical protein